VWLYLSYYLGMHTSGIASVQVMSCISLLITLIGYILAFREFGRVEPGFTFPEGLRTGTTVAVITAVIALLTQVGYFKLIHPGFTEYMVGESLNYAEAQGLSTEQIETFTEAAKRNFSFKSYLIQSSIGALLFGSIFSIIILTVRRIRSRR